MLQGAKQLLYHFWDSIVNVGVHPAMPFIESRRTKLLNLLILPGIPLMIIFSIVNAVQGIYLLSVLNLLTTCMALTVLVLHKYRLYLSARTVLIFFSVIVYTFTGLYFHNGAEYFLLNIMVISILIYDNKWLVGCLSALIIMAFLLIVFMPQSWYLAPPVPTRRIWGNVAVALIFPAVALSYFKHIQSDYQREIEKQRQALLDMNKDKEKLFSIVAHDIRSPLAILESLLQMFQQGRYPHHEMEEAAAELYKKVAQLRGSLDNVLRWSARSMKGIQTRPQHFLLAPVMSEVIQFFDLIIQQKNITVDLLIPASTALYADRDQVSVILRNLFSNALKFSYPGGRVEIIAGNISERTAIRITDYGMGMSPQQVKTLFTAQQLPGYGTDGERGTGLGLILCQEFVEMNRGYIGVESHPGQGTTFTVTLDKGNVPVSEPSVAN
jgi:signal transduction histidine kinase